MGMATSQAPAASVGPWDKFRAQTRFGSLDGLRCFAILAVIWHHGAGLGSTGFASQGYYGVPLFFAISGFLITTLLLRERSEAGSISLRKFYARRALRIFPLYYAVLGLYAVLLWLRPWLEGTEQFFRKLPLFAVYLTNWINTPGMKFGFGWSLAVEEQFYATWPVLLAYAPAVVSTSVVGVAFAAAFVFDLYTTVPLPITGGALLALALHSRRGFDIVWRLLGWRLAPVACLGAALLAIALIERLESPIVHFALTLLVAACIVREDHALAPLLRIRWVAYLGTISYGMYLLHELVFAGLGLNPFGWEQHSASGFFVAVPVTALVAGLSYRYFEGPFLRIKRRFQASPD